MTDNKQFVATVENWVADAEERALMVARDAIDNLTNDAQTTTDRGGRMRYKTGFLSASGRAALGSMPSGPNVRPVDAVNGQFSWDGDAVTTVLASLEPGDVFYYGWTANYAEVRNTYDGFLDAPVQNWQKYVDDAVMRLRRAAGDR